MREVSVYSDNPLRRARLERGIPLSELTARTCLSPRIVQQIDAGQFDRLPGGLYARSYVRAFASVVELDPERVVRELAEYLPPEEDPFPALRENARAVLPPWGAWLTEWPERAVSWTSARLRLLRPVPHVPRLPPTRLAAVLVDACVLFLLYAVFIRLTAWIAGMSVHEALELAGVAVVVPWTMLAVTYFVLLGGIGGRTAGAAVCGLRARPAAEPLYARAICLRALNLTADSISPRSSKPDSRWPTDLAPARRG
jgi:hypothetical protein